MLRSQKLYECLLTLYPKAHRDAYGRPMAQLFRDQCRDAWQAERGWGVARLWLRVLPDLLRTSLLEHLATMKGKKTMTDKISEVTGRSAAPLRILIRVAVPVFLLVFGLSVIVTFLLPETFSSKARVKVEREAVGQNRTREGVADDPYFIQTVFAAIQSEVILGRVIERLDLNSNWGKKYGGGSKLNTAESLALLKGRLELRQIRNSSLIEILVYSEDRDEAARIANAIAESYTEHCRTQRQQLTTAGIKALTDRFQEQQERIKKAQNELEHLRTELGLSDMDAQGTNLNPSITADALRSLEAQWAEASIRVNELRLSFAKLRSLTKAELRQVLPRTRPDQLLIELLSQLNLAEQELSRIKSDFPADHPQFIRVRSQVEALNKKVDDSMTGAMIAIENQLEIAEAGIAATKKQVEDAKKNNSQRALTSRPFFDKKRELEQLYGFARILETKMSSEKIDLKLQQQSTAIEIMDRAVAGLRPVRPNKPLNIVLGAFGGMVLALLIGGGAALIVSRIGKRTPAPAAAS